MSETAQQVDIALKTIKNVELILSINNEEAASL